MNIFYTAGWLANGDEIVIAIRPLNKDVMVGTREELGTAQVYGSVTLTPGSFASAEGRTMLGDYLESERFKSAVVRVCDGSAASDSVDIVGRTIDAWKAINEISHALATIRQMSEAQL